MASKYEMQDEEDVQRGFLDSIKNLALHPFRLAFSSTARRAYLTTFLVVTTSFLLLSFAITAYILFYWSYIPRIGFERVVHLQFDTVYDAANIKNIGTPRQANPFPYGTVDLRPDIVSAQPYDVVVELIVPRTPENVAAGNFMLEVALLGPEDKTTANMMEALHTGMVPSSVDTAALLARSRRPAILPYRSPLIELAYKFTELHWYLLNFRSEAEHLRISMFEGVEFPKGWRNVPATLRLEVQSTSRLQIYHAKAVFRARFRGLRWLMYNHRIVSAILFITSFWTTEMLFAGAAWAVVGMILLPRTQQAKSDEVLEVADRVKTEPDEDELEPKLSDTERTFPTTSGQPPLRYQSETRVKVEDDDGAVVVPEHVARAAEADVEDEDEDADFFDSGLGTSLESSSVNRRESMRRRRGRLATREEG